MQRRTILHLATVRLDVYPPLLLAAPVLNCLLHVGSSATSSGGRRTGPVPQLDSSSGPAANQQSLSGGDADVRGQQRNAQQQQGLDPSAAESLDTRKEAAEELAARYRASRERLHDAGGVSGDVDVDVGA